MSVKLDESFDEELPQYVISQGSLLEDQESVDLDGSYCEVHIQSALMLLKRDVWSPGNGLPADRAGQSVRDEFVMQDLIFFLHKRSLRAEAERPAPVGAESEGSGAAQ